MEQNSKLPEWPNQPYYRWVFLSVLAYILSFVSAYGTILFFPLFVTIAHYITIKTYTVVVRPGLWFITFPITMCIWLRWGPIAYLHTANYNGILYGVGGYYAGQLLNALLIPSMTNRHPSSTAFTSNQTSTDLMLGWMLANILAAGIWVALYSLYTHLSSEALAADQRMIGWISLIIVYPAISLIANSLSGFALPMNTTVPVDDEDQQDYEDVALS